MTTRRTDYEAELRRTGTSVPVIHTEPVDGETYAECVQRVLGAARDAGLSPDQLRQSLGLPEVTQ